MNQENEALVTAGYAVSVAAIQRLIKSLEKCAKTKGRRTLFGKDKFQPAMGHFKESLGQCVESLKEDGKLERRNTSEEEIAAIHAALSVYRSAGKKWHFAFDFWDQWYADFMDQLPEIPRTPSNRLRAWLEARDKALHVKRSFAEAGGHILLSQEVYDADALDEPLRSEAIIHMRRLRDQDKE